MRNKVGHQLVADGLCFVAPKGLKGIKALRLGQDSPVFRIGSIIGYPAL